MPQDYTTKLIKRFNKKICINPETGCWDWIGTKDSKGYGKIWVGEKLARSHRVAYTIHVGNIPDGLIVCHHCDNPGCVNPDHLFVGTNADNMKDKTCKGRARGQGKGESHSLAKLTEDDIRSIRKEKASGVRQRVLARKYGVSEQHMSDICKGRYWSHVK